MWRISDTKRNKKCTAFSRVFFTYKRFLTAFLGILLLSISQLTSAQTTLFDLSQPVQPSSAISGNDGTALAINCAATDVVAPVENKA